MLLLVALCYIIGFLLVLCAAVFLGYVAIVLWCLFMGFWDYYRDQKKLRAL